MKVYCGTSGYSYKEWKGGFYPSDLAADAMLGYYAERLPAVEINNTFYRMPKRELMERWASQVPDGFQFVIKASRRLTHQTKLQDPSTTLGFLWGSIQKLGPHLGRVLFQLPKWLRKDVELLREFLAATGGRDHYRAAFEFQHRTWFADDTYEVLRDAGAAIVISDQDGCDVDAALRSTSDWGYLRMRREDYSDADLAAYHARILETGWDEAFVFFKHEDDCGGPELAARFQALFA